MHCLQILTIVIWHIQEATRYSCSSVLVNMIFIVINNKKLLLLIRYLDRFCTNQLEDRKNLIGFHHFTQTNLKLE